MGGFSFHVDPGVYSLKTDGECAFAPSSAALDLHADTIQGFNASRGIA
jgi:hypothetical protein